jgi:hypothetical protein
LVGEGSCEAQGEQCAEYVEYTLRLVVIKEMAFASTKSIPGFSREAVQQIGLLGCVKHTF